MGRARPGGEEGYDGPGAERASQGPCNQPYLHYWWKALPSAWITTILARMVMHQFNVRFLELTNHLKVCG